jgi:hypothetical protein
MVWQAERATREATTSGAPLVAFPKGTKFPEPARSEGTDLAGQPRRRFRKSRYAALGFPKVNNA